MRDWRMMSVIATMVRFYRNRLFRQLVENRARAANSCVNSLAAALPDLPVTGPSRQRAESTTGNTGSTGSTAEIAGRQAPAIILATDIRSPIGGGDHGPSASTTLSENCS